MGLIIYFGIIFIIRKITGLNNSESCICRTQRYLLAC